MRRAAVAGGTTIAAVAVYLLLRDAAGVVLDVRAGTSVNHVGAAAVAITALAAALAGWGVLALLERLTARSRPIWYTLATLAFLVSLLGPLGGVSTGAKLGLAALHLTVATAVVLGLPLVRKPLVRTPLVSKAGGQA